MYRHHPQTARLIELFRDGAIGRLRLIRSCFRYPTTDETNIRLSAALEGGSLMDLGCYCVNVARLVAGEPERVYAEQTIAGTGVEVALQGILRFAGGIVAQIDSSLAAPMRQDLELVGEDGTLRVAAPFRVDLGRSGIELSRGDRLELIEVEEQDSYALQLAGFADAVHGSPSLAAADDSIGQARVISCLYQSAGRCCPVTIHPTAARATEFAVSPQGVAAL